MYLRFFFNKLRQPSDRFKLLRLRPAELVAEIPTFQSKRRSTSRIWAERFKKMQSNVFVSVNPMWKYGGVMCWNVVW